MIQQRTFDKIISVPFYINVPTAYFNDRYYFRNNPFVGKNRVKAISVTNNIGTDVTVFDCYITLVDQNNQSLINNYPLLPLTIYGNSFPDLRLTYFDLENLDLSRSYIIYTAQTGITNSNPFNINFYF